MKKDSFLKRHKKNKGIDKFTIVAIGFIVILATACGLIGSLIRKSVPVVVPIIKEQYTDKEDTTIEVNGTDYNYTINYNGPNITGGGNSGGSSGSDDSGGGTPGTPTPGTPIEATDTIKMVYKLLKEMGYSDEMCAGIMGNIEVESGMQFGTVQKHHDGSSTDWTTNEFCTPCKDINGTGYAHGLVQWDGGRRNTMLANAISSGVAWTDSSYQLGVMRGELEGNYYGRWCSPSNMLSGLPNGASAVEYSCYRWARFYEACGGVGRNDTYESRVNYSHWDRRIAAANDYYAGIIGGNYN